MRGVATGMRTMYATAPARKRGMDSLLVKDGGNGGTDMVAEGEEGLESESV